MEELRSQNETIKQYADLISDLKKKVNQNIVGVIVDVSIEGDNITLSVGENKLWLTPEQAIDLIQQIRRAIVKINPRLLRYK